MEGEIVAVCLSDRQGVQKEPVEEALCRENHGFVGDAHAGTWHRQVSLLAEESADEIRRAGYDVAPGAFGENLLTRGIDLKQVRVGVRLKVGEQVVLEVTQLGKKCHSGCAIFYAVGKCVMPTDGVFCRVLQGGRIRPGDRIGILGGGGSDGVQGGGAGVERLAGGRQKEG